MGGCSTHILDLLHAVQSSGGEDMRRMRSLSSLNCFCRATAGSNWLPSVEHQLLVEMPGRVLLLLSPRAFELCGSHRTSRLTVARSRRLCVRTWRWARPCALTLCVPQHFTSGSITRPEPVLVISVLVRFNRLDL